MPSKGLQEACSEQQRPSRGSSHSGHRGDGLMAGISIESYRKSWGTLRKLYHRHDNRHYHDMHMHSQLHPGPGSYTRQLAICAVSLVAYMSDTSSEGSRSQRGDRGVQRLEKILSKHTGEPRDAMPGRTPSEETVAEQPLLKGASMDGLSMDNGRDAVQLVYGMYSCVHEQLTGFARQLHTRPLCLGSSSSSIWRRG